MNIHRDGLFQGNLILQVHHVLKNIFCDALLSVRRRKFHWFDSLLSEHHSQIHS